LLHVDIVSSLSHLQALSGLWTGLYAEAGCRLPFLQLSWIQNWWRVFGHSTYLTRNELMIMLVRDGSCVIGALPLYKTTYGFRLGLGLRYVRPIGSDPNITEVRTALMLPGRESATLGEIGRYFIETSGSWDLLNWSSFPMGLAPPPQPGLFTTVRQPPVEMFLRHLPASWDDFVGPLTRNTKESIRRAHNALKRDGLEADFCVLEKADEILALLPRFLDLHGRRADLGGVASHPNVFGEDRHRDFLAWVIQAMSVEGMVRLFALRVRGEIVALRLGFVINDTLYLYYSGFDPAYAKYSVTTRLVVEAFKWAMRSGIATVNLSSGRDRSKTRWAPEVVSYQNYWQVAPRWRSRTAFAIIKRLLPVSHGHGTLPGNSSPLDNSAG
jgi:CelD/BcsL family acetyltransferase involved in cellulose biosynthesis